MSVVHALDEAHPRVALRYLDTIIKRRREAGTLTLMDLFTLSAWLETKREESKRRQRMVVRDEQGVLRHQWLCSGGHDSTALVLRAQGAEP